MIDNIANAFITSSETVADFFQKPGLGFYIPLYQREYSWDNENIDQLMEDICQGVEHLLSNDKEIRFMGTIIRVKESNPKENVRPIDERALPTRIDNIIDGQQRISTIALLGALVYQHLSKIEENLPTNEQVFIELGEEIHSKLQTIRELFSVDLRRGKPSRKPIIIRGSIDNWTLSGPVTNTYRSNVSEYLALCIDAIDSQTPFPKIPSGHLVGRNLNRMNRWLNRVEKAHENNGDDDEREFPTATEILKGIDETYIWSYQRPELKNIVENPNSTSPEKFHYISSLVQLLAFSHYLLYRCCFTTIDPVSEDWAFDMFQSLNATGTPLTAIETFKPLVVNWTNMHGNGYKDSDTEKHFNQVDNLFVSENSAAKKSRLTNEYLTALALAYDGSKLPRQFSRQRQWLTDYFNKCLSNKERDEFVHFMGDLALYFHQVLTYDPEQLPFFPKLSDIPNREKELTTLCILYLQDAGHRMAHTVLCQFYANIIRGKSGSSKELATSAKALAAFYTLWRAASSNAGLDNVYRTLLKGSSKDGLAAMSWQSSQDNLSARQLQVYLKEVLAQKGLGNKDDWVNRATQNLRYDLARPVCKFGLFVTAEDTIIDSLVPGLMRAGVVGSSTKYLTPEMWYSKKLGSIEHIAPQDPTPQSQWDERFYEQDDYHQIGNLTLLPVSINSSVKNPNWSTKWVYYRHLAENDPLKLDELKNLAQQYNIKLLDNNNTLQLLKSAAFNHHMLPIIKVAINDRWDLDLVKARTQRICSILWDRLIVWIDSN